MLRPVRLSQTYDPPVPNVRPGNTDANAGYCPKPENDAPHLWICRLHGSGKQKLEQIRTSQPQPTSCKSKIREKNHEDKVATTHPILPNAAIPVQHDMAICRRQTALQQDNAQPRMISPIPHR